MPEFLQRESNKITIANFYESYLLGKFNFDPPYQRRSLWTDEKKSFLIDSIIRNFPIPPIFLHQKIDDETGQTSYDVIDGKQRLGAILAFINNEVPITSETGSEKKDEEDGLSDISGLYFNDLNSDLLKKYKGRFWRYVIPVEYIDTGDGEVIDSIFDRLNRNGEPLVGQELRNANFYSSPFLRLIDEFSKSGFWKTRLEIVDKSRMEDHEFVSELAFLLLEGSELNANQLELDTLYAKYSNMDSQSIKKLTLNFSEVTEYLDGLGISYETRKVAGVSHLYGFFSFCHCCLMENKDMNLMRSKLNEFLDLWQSKFYDNEFVRLYKESMSSRTKSGIQRRRRTDALKKFCF